MKIFESNGSILNSKEVYIHDDVLENVFFERSTRELCLSCYSEIWKGTLLEKKKYNIKYSNVIGFEMTSCNFWMDSPYIFDFIYIEQSDRIIIPKVLKKKNLLQCEPYSCLAENRNYIETEIVFTSGDNLIVACEYIVLEKCAI